MGILEKVFGRVRTYFRHPPGTAPVSRLMSLDSHVQSHQELIFPLASVGEFGASRLDPFRARAQG